MSIYYANCYANMCYNTACPTFQLNYVTGFQCVDCSESNTCKFFQPNPNYFTTTSAISEQYNGKTVIVDGTQETICNPSSGSCKKGKIIKLKAKLVKKQAQTFEEKLDAWYHKVLNAYEASKEDDPSEDILIIFDTKQMIKDVDEIIAEGFGHIKVIDEE